jgi:hypothetical protein
VFVGLTSSAVVADLVEAEPLIGAFFVDVGLNRLVPNTTPLMAVTDFFVLAVTENPETSSASVVSPMNPPLGRTLCA